MCWLAELRGSVSCQPVILWCPACTPVRCTCVVCSTKSASNPISWPLGFLKLWTQLFGEREKKGEAKPAVGIVYVNGPIMTGKGMASPFGGSIGAFSSDVAEALKKATTDDSIKAVVLRVDSPGG